jgi:glycerol kinase
MSVLAIDAGTTGVTALIISAGGAVAGRGYEEFRQYYPQPGWVEHLPEGIWQATLGACRQALDGAEPEVWAGVTGGSLAVGTVDSYLVARLTSSRRHVTDASNASRTLLFDIEAGQCSAELCQLLRVPPHALPEVVPSSGLVGHSDPAAFLGLSLPVAGIAGDQQAAMFGQARFSPGSVSARTGPGRSCSATPGPRSSARRPGCCPRWRGWTRPAR